MHKPSYEAWIESGMKMGWVMPCAPWWKRQPIIRNIRAGMIAWKVHKHNEMWASIGAFSQGFDEWVIWGIANGLERPTEAKPAEGA